MFFKGKEIIRAQEEDMTFPLTLNIEKVTVVRRKHHTDSISFTTVNGRWFTHETPRCFAEAVLDNLGIPLEYIEIIDVDKIQEAKGYKPPTFSGKERK